MVTKSEEENIMDKAVGSKIADYLIKPVNPNQVLLSIKKNVHQQRLVTEQTAADYRSEFGAPHRPAPDGRHVRRLVLALPPLTGWRSSWPTRPIRSIREVLAYQKSEANQEFSKFVRRNYRDWINRRTDDTPVMSRTRSCARKILPEAERHAKTTLLLIDNFRYDQWRAIVQISLLRTTTTWPPTSSTAPSCPHRHAIRAQRRLRRTDAAGHLAPDARPVAQRDNEEGGKEPARGGSSCGGCSCTAGQAALEVDVRQAHTPRAGPAPRGQHRPHRRRRLLGDRHHNFSTTSSRTPAPRPT